MRNAHVSVGLMRRGGKIYVDLSLFVLLFSRVGHSVLLRSERYDLSRSQKRTLRSFTFFSRVFGDL